MYELGLVKWLIQKLNYVLCNELHLGNYELRCLMTYCAQLLKVLHATCYNLRWYFSVINSEVFCVKEKMNFNILLLCQMEL